MLFPREKRGIQAIRPPEFFLISNIDSDQYSFVFDRQPSLGTARSDRVGMSVEVRDIAHVVAVLFIQYASGSSRAGIPWATSSRASTTWQYCHGAGRNGPHSG